MAMETEYEMLEDEFLERFEMEELRNISFLEMVSNSLWHAFDSLDLNKCGEVSKSKLKVLSSYIGSIVSLCDIEKGLEDFKSKSELTFEDYEYYLSKEVFCSLPDNMEYNLQNMYQDKISEMCWLIYRKEVSKRSQPIFDNSCVYKLFRIFCTLAENVPDPRTISSVAMNCQEVELFLNKISTSLGREMDNSVCCKAIDAVDNVPFPSFLALLEIEYSHEKIDVGLYEIIDDMYDTFVNDVLKKGHLQKKGDILPIYRDYWFLLTPRYLSYYTDQNSSDRKGEIKLSSSSRVQSITDSLGQNTHKFYLISDEKTYFFNAANHKTRLQWLHALEIAIENSRCNASYQKSQAKIRQLNRGKASILAILEKEKRFSQMGDIKKTKEELEAERMARVAAEEEARIMYEQKEEDRRKLKELEYIREELENLLEEEKQALRDEEIVRALQSRALREEWNKKEELERLQLEQKELLNAERAKRVEFEKLEQEKEQQLSAAQMKLLQVEEEREKIDQLLKVACEKIKLLEKNKEILGSKLMLFKEQDKEGSEVSKITSAIIKRHQSLREPYRCRPLRTYARVTSSDDLELGNMKKRGN